ncbi:MAG TPA: BadF/BadG/BcrA/BcrD ATPase family protein [Anaerolineaceae bacterium]
MTPEYLLGIDGGGTKTLALLADLEENIIGRGVGGASNYQAVGRQAAFSAIQTAVDGALQEAKVEKGKIAALCLGLAGVDRPGDRELVEAWVHDQYPQAEIRIVNDARPVLAAGTPADWGIVVICGTGSLVFGVDREGRLVRSGGWGYLIGDEGSGYALGLAGLRSVARSIDGRGKATVLKELVFNTLQITKPEELVPRVYQTPLTKAEIASLADLINLAADQGDEVARTLLAEAGYELALAVSAVYKQLWAGEPVPAAFTGGVILNSGRVRDAMMEALRREGITLDPLKPVSTPALGALRLAKKALAMS